MREEPEDTELDFESEDDVIIVLPDDVDSPAAPPVPPPVPVSRRPPVIAGSPLANLFHEQISFTCGDCHLGSAGANNRYGDFRSSGCTACHMRYSQDGRSRSSDPRIRKNEPLNPDAIDAPERPHVARHRIASIAKTLTTGEQAQGIDDYTCAGCHQGSNRTVMQYWGIRLDQNADLGNRVQLPFQLGIDTHNKINQIQPNTLVFYCPTPSAAGWTRTTRDRGTASRATSRRMVWPPTTSSTRDSARPWGRTTSPRSTSMSSGTTSAGTPEIR